MVAVLIQDCWAAESKLRPSFEAICERLEAVRVAGAEEAKSNGSKAGGPAGGGGQGADQGCACAVQ